MRTATGSARRPSKAVGRSEASRCGAGCFASVTADVLALAGLVFVFLAVVQICHDGHLASQLERDGSARERRVFLNFGFSAEVAVHAPALSTTRAGPDLSGDKVREGRSASCGSHDTSS